MTFFTKSLFITGTALLMATALSAQNNFFENVSDRSLPTAMEVTKNIRKMSILQLDEPAMRNYLRSAPMEFRNEGNPIPLEIPLPDGTTEIFGVVESPNLSPELAAQFPEIKTYAGNGLTHKEYTIRLNLTSLGLFAILLNVEGDAVYFEHYSKENPDVYFSYFTKDAVAPEGFQRGTCGVGIDGETHENIQDFIVGDRNNTGATLRTYRLALAANGEFTVQNGGTQSSGLAAVTNYVTTLNTVYGNELSVRFTLVPNNINLIYTNPATDPYTANTPNALLADNQINVDAVIGNANYDVSHVLGYDVTFGSGGGVAALGSVCSTVEKASGGSVIGSGYGQVFYDQLLLHELGHQFGMNHSYNSVIPVCETRNAGTSAEPGAGATIMSYGFTCNNTDPTKPVGDDNYPTSNPGQTGPFLNFHTVSFIEAEALIAGTANCFVGTATGNSPPVVTMPSGFTIPKSTPFSLTGSASGSGSLTYSWEGTNVGTSTPTPTTLANTAQPPFFRSYEPSTSPTRHFPPLPSILDGTNYVKGDKLPSVGIVTTHNLTVRDGLGGVSFGSVAVTVDGSIGPFLETTILAPSYTGGSMLTVTWSVNGTNTATPNVKISLSTDGGNTFPTVLAASTANDGSESVTLPNVITSTARIKVEAVGNVFFDISNANFAISAPLPVELVSFEAQLTKENEVLLNWKTASEQNNRGFEVQRADETASLDELTWRSLGFMAGNGTTVESHQYSFLDEKPTPGVNYYRLSQSDFDGKEEYSQIESVELPVLENNFTDLKIYPNPSLDGWYNLEMAAVYKGQLIVEITNTVGQTVNSFKFQNEGGGSKIQVPAPGVYFVAVTLQNGLTFSKKLIALDRY